MTPVTPLPLVIAIIVVPALAFADLEAIKAEPNLERRSQKALDYASSRLDEARKALAALDERKSRVVELRFFGGLTADETALALQVSSKTELRDWEFARAWLHRELTREAGRDA